jgi:predicted ATP-grasp superfamily ATP-dependent carboligase
MSKWDELNKKALEADSLRQQGMTRAEIATHLGKNERQVSRLLARAGRHYRRLVENFDQEIFLGESLVTWSKIEKEALKNFEALDAGDPLAVEWLQAALDVRAQMVEMAKIIVFGRTKSGVRETPGKERKSWRDRSRSKLRKLRKERDLHCVRPDSQGPDSPDSI